MDSIEYLKDVWSPRSQAGKTGDVKEIGKDIDPGAARYLLRGDYVKLKKRKPNVNKSKDPKCKAVDERTPSPSVE